MAVPEFSKSDCPGAVCVEHPDHHPDGVRVETGEIPVHERVPELFFRQLSRAFFVDCFEEWEQRGVFVRSTAARSWCWWRARGLWRAVVVLCRGRAEAVVCRWWGVAVAVLVVGRGAAAGVVCGGVREVVGVVEGAVVGLGLDRLDWYSLWRVVLVVR